MTFDVLRSLRRNSLFGMLKSKKLLVSEEGATFYNDSEIELIKQQLRVANHEARKVARARGVVLDPRIAAARGR